MAQDYIPVANPRLQYLSYKEEIDQAIQNVLSAGRYILGDSVRAFENAFAQFLGVKWCIGVGNGTDAIHLALRALGIGAGSEVITVSHTAVATVAAIEMAGATPVFVDIDPGSRCMNPGLISHLISDKTRAIIPVHIYGQPADMERIISIARENHLYVIEDCAQAHGAKINGKTVGTFGDVACFSFYPTKNLGAIGDGGAIVTSNDELGARIRWLREYGWKERYISEFAGVNSRLDEIQAAILQVKLGHLERDNQKRNWLARQYLQELSGTNFQLPALQDDMTHAMHLFVIQHDRRDKLKDYLEKGGIGTAIHYPLAVHQQPAYRGRITGWDQLPETEALAKKILSLPMYPELSAEEVHKVCKKMIEWDRQVSK